MALRGQSQQKKRWLQSKEQNACFQGNQEILLQAHPYLHSEFVILGFYVAAYFGLK